MFHAALRGSFAGAFAAVVFAVLDTSPERRFIGPFEREFVQEQQPGEGSVPEAKMQGCDSLRLIASSPQKGAQ